MTNLRSDLIKLAHQNPALRPHLLPILKEAGSLDNLSDVLVGTIKMLCMGPDFDKMMVDTIKSWARKMKLEVKNAGQLSDALLNAVNFADLVDLVDKTKVEAAKEKFTTAMGKTAVSQPEAADAAVRIVEEHIPALEVRIAPIMKKLNADVQDAGYTKFPAYLALKKAAEDLDKAGKDLKTAIDKDWNGED